MTNMATNPVCCKKLDTVSFPHQLTDGFETFYVSSGISSTAKIV